MIILAIFASRILHFKDKFSQLPFIEDIVFFRFKMLVEWWKKSVGFFNRNSLECFFSSLCCLQWYLSNNSCHDILCWTQSINETADITIVSILCDFVLMICPDPRLKIIFKLFVVKISRVMGRLSCPPAPPVLMSARPPARRITRTFSRGRIQKIQKIQKIQNFKK